MSAEYCIFRFERAFFLLLSILLLSISLCHVFFPKLVFISVPCCSLGSFSCTVSGVKPFQQLEPLLRR